MKRSIQLAGGLLACVVSTTAVKARINGVEAPNPYRVIVERNVFDLKPPPPPPTNEPAQAPPPPNVRLTGITSILGKKRALFMVKEPDTPGKQPHLEESYILCEGQRQNGLEVLEIDEKANTVKISNDGNVSVITFETPKLANAAPGGPGGGPPPSPPTFAPPQPGSAPGNFPSAGLRARYGAGPGSDMPMGKFRQTGNTMPPPRLPVSGQ